MKKLFLLIILAIVALNLKAVSTSMVNGPIPETVQFMAHPWSYPWAWHECIAMDWGDGAYAYGISEGVEIRTYGWMWGYYICTATVDTAYVEFRCNYDTNWARVLLDGKEVWTGDTNTSSSSIKTLVISGLSPGVHKVQVEYLQDHYLPSRPVVRVRGFAFTKGKKDSDGDGIPDDEDCCPDSKIKAPFTKLNVDKYGCTPNQNMSQLMVEYFKLNLKGHEILGSGSMWNGRLANISFNTDLGHNETNIVKGIPYMKYAIYIDSDVNRNTPCVCYQEGITEWLNTMYFLKSKVIDPSVSTTRTYSDLFNGLDFCPIQAWGGCHRSAVVYYTGYSWKNGKVLDPWPIQNSITFNASYWSNELYRFCKPDTNPRYKGRFPLLGGDYKQSDPGVEASWSDKMWDWLAKLTTKISLDCQVLLNIQDTKTGKRLGYFNGNFVNEIPKALYVGQKISGNKDKNWVAMLPDSVYKVGIEGLGDDTFLLKTSYKDKGIFTYGTQSIKKGQVAKVTVDRNNPKSPMTLPNGTKVTPKREKCEIDLPRTSMVFCATKSGATSPAQTLRISNSKSGTMNWSVSTNINWLKVNPASGSGDGLVGIKVKASTLANLAVGTHKGKITINSTNATNSPQTVDVTLKIYNNNSTQPPFGSFATPKNNAKVYSSIPVTGWVLDDIGVTSLKIYRGNAGSLIYVGDAVFVEGARPDVEQAYPGYPMNYQAGWGYMMLTNFLPNGGNGTFKLHAIATDAEGKQKTLGIKTITCDNKNAVKPFGAIDTPTQGGTASGNGFINWGWVLAPPPNRIPASGNTIDVWVDGVKLGHPAYNMYRKDIAERFKSYSNSNGAIGYFKINTTAYKNGVHTIQWTATDKAGHTDGIGSRYFTIQNTGADLSSSTGFELEDQALPFLENIPVDFGSPVIIKRGVNHHNIEPYLKDPDEQGVIRINSRELDRIEIQLLPEETEENEKINIMGYSMVGNTLRPLPIGSRIKDGRFYWHMGPGFYGEHRLIFIIKDRYGDLTKKLISVEIGPKFLIKE
jgi:hypothetical protein